MSIVARKIAASPLKNASQVWDKISDIVCHDSSEYLDEFSKVKGGVSSIISEKIPNDRPIIIRGGGPLLRIYCLYGDNAFDQEEVNEDFLNWSPLSNDWKVYIPCPKTEMDELQKFFKKRSENFLVYDSKETITFQKSESMYQSSEIQIDENALRSL